MLLAGSKCAFNLLTPAKEKNRKHTDAKPRTYRKQAAVLAKKGRGAGPDSSLTVAVQKYKNLKIQNTKYLLFFPPLIAMRRVKQHEHDNKYESQDD